MMYFNLQEASYFDVVSHGTGAICTTLAVEVSTIKGVRPVSDVEL
jgi:hypothetical protein